MASYLGRQAPLRKKGTSQCIYHKKKDLIFICNNCKELICSTCCVSTHKNHDLSELSENIEKKKKGLLEFINQAEGQTLPKLKKDIQDLGKRETESSDKLKEVVTKFKQHGEECKHEIDVQISEFSFFCDDIKERNKDVIMTLKTEIQQRYDDLDKLVKESKQVLQTGTAVQVYDVDLTMNHTDFHTQDLQMVEFCPGEFIIDNIREALGTVTSHNDPNLRVLDQPEVLSQFEFDPSVTRLLPTPDDRCWFSDDRSDLIILMDHKGEIKQEIKHDCNVTDISWSRNTGLLLFCCVDDKTIYEVEPTSESPVTRFTIEREPRSLCVTRDENVVVGTLFSVSVYTLDGTVLHTTTSKESGIRDPWDICECPLTGNIAVVSNDSGESCIIVCANELTMRFQYRGEGIPGVTPDKFCPLRICYDSRGHLVIADWRRSTIELISGRGQYIRTLHTNDGPQGYIEIQTDDVVWTWLGSDKTYVKLFKYYKG